MSDVLEWLAFCVAVAAYAVHRTRRATAVFNEIVGREGESS